MYKHFLLILYLAISSLSASEFNYSCNIAIDELKVGVELNVFDPPLNLEFSDLIRDSSGNINIDPEIIDVSWLVTYQVLYKLDSFSEFNEVKSLCSGNYLEKYKITEGLFNEIKANPEFHLENPEKSVVIYVVEFSIDGMSYLAVVRSQNIHTEKPPLDYNSLGNVVNAIFMEKSKETNKWILSTVNDYYQWTRMFVSDSIAGVKDEIIKSEVK